MDSTQIIIGISTLVGGYFIGRKKNKAEVRKIEAATTIDELSATEKAVAIWRGLAEELRGEVEQLRELVNQLKKEINELRKQNADLSEEMRVYKTQIHDKTN